MKAKHPGRFYYLLALIFLTCSNNKKNINQVNTAVNIVPPQRDTTVVSTPPAGLQLDSFYTKYLEVSGIPVVGSEQVPDEAFYKVREIVDEMLSLRADIPEKMIANKIRIAIMAKKEMTTDMPEYRNWNDPSQSEGIDWNTRGRGFGATVDLPLTSCAEENLLCYGKEIDWYSDEDIFIHEFAHSIHSLGISFIDTEIDRELQTALDNAIAKGLWKNTYAATNIYEYFAEGVQDWFNVNAKVVPANGTHNEISTREALRNYDPDLYAIIERYFPASNKRISCHQKKSRAQQ